MGGSPGEAGSGYRPALRRSGRMTGAMVVQVAWRESGVKLPLVCWSPADDLSTLGSSSRHAGPRKSPFGCPDSRSDNKLWISSETKMSRDSRDPLIAFSDAPCLFQLDPTQFWSVRRAAMPGFKRSHWQKIMASKISTRPRSSSPSSSAPNCPLLSNSSFESLEPRTGP